MNKNIPKLADRILRIILPDNARDFLIGDIEDIYNSKLNKYGSLYSYLWVYYTLLINFPGFLKSSIQWGITMFLNNLKIAFRHIWRQKFFSAINIFCLTLSLLATVFIWLWINDELSYDDFHRDLNSLYRLEVHFELNNKSELSGHTPQFLGEELQKEFKAVTNFVTFHRRYNTIIKSGNEIYQTKFAYYSTPEISNLFNIELIDGDINAVLQDPASIVLSESLAEKIFKDVNPVGKAITLNDEHSLIVRGVYKDLPNNSHLKMKCIIPISVLKPSYDWGRYDFENYIKVSEESSAESFNHEIKNFLKKYRDTESTIKILPFKDIHLFASYGDGNVDNIYFFSLIGLILLAVGCINYINLSTARSTLREKEIGIRKVVGAEKYHLIKQLFTESLLTTIISFLITFILIFLLFNQFNLLANKEIALNELLNNNILIGISLMFLFTTVISGIYPAFYISKYNPYRNIYSKGKTGNSRIRKILILSQFVVAMVLITFTVLVNEQLDYIQNKKLGFDKEQIVCIQTNKLGTQLNSFKNKINQLPGVVKTSVASQMPVNMGNYTMVNSWDNYRSEKSIMFYIMSADQNFLDLMGIELAEGSNFLPHHNEENVLVNETALLKTGLKNPLNKKIKYWGYSASIQGVLKDFHNKPLHKKIVPMILYHNKGEQGSYLFVKFNSKEIKELLLSAENIYKKYSSSTPFNYTFIDERIDRMYKSEINFQLIVKYFSFITILTALLGLIGLTVFTAERKTKEIGIRKVLGASVSNLINLVSKEFIILIGLSALISIPIAYYFVDLWLGNYSYKVDITFYPFVISSFGIVVLSYLTILFNTYNKVNINPVESIKDE